MNSPALVTTNGGSRARSVTGVAGRRRPQMWRYKLVHLDLPEQESPQVMACEAGLNELGSEGWEAISVVQTAGRWWVLLKMPHEVASF